MNYKKEQEKIIEELLQNRKIQVGELIDYAYFSKLYQPYAKQMTEPEFANILEISYINYLNIKNKGSRAKILKGKKVTEEERQNILEELLQNGKIKPRELIDYTYFSELYQPYAKQMSEQEFANILEISYINYLNIKNKGQRAKVLKNKKKEITEAEKQNIIKELLQNRKIQEGQSINYAYFKELYQPYEKQMSEPEFASLLSISYSSYTTIKNTEGRAKVLKNKKKIITEEEKQNIVEELLQNRNIQVGELIDYAYFSKLYQPYSKQMPESEFASLLGIGYSNYTTIKNRGSKARVLKNKKKDITEAEKQNIVEELLQNRNIQVGELIDYAHFSKLYQPYSKQITEKEFASFLGISYINYMTIKNQGSRARVLKYKEKEVTEEEKQNIVEELLQSGKIQLEQPISYAYFKELYQPYAKQISEREFANILEIRYSSYINIKNQGTRAKVLKNRKKEINKIKETSYDTNLTTSKGEYDSFKRRLKDNRVNTEEEAIRKIEKERIEEKCAKLVMRGIQEGLDKKQALIEASKSLGIKPTEVLTIIKEMQAKRKKKQDDEIEK